ncbi:hypothetical protein A3I99_04170 [Candidatus Kaiserbacteria bacterium RIFCSPLOWO2_02_FULL_45_11b]|uniref:Uncharacterized protein n=1 Tax=Candidatus Kaiserbacteria bacterium RIFCSPLOWO2_12_FULL_45_26 TaxID=1798525 RepID=A0A1F6FHC7_9BACT|nr:MAG: hypothetical protein A2Z56_00665 [Candidatus Kaiserbacteria bacterium RIFCSPHIGHO2_12_45_16]OGG70105.1 MAG: hypothetical protein A2929_03385 [Candidatus Kaiserbacteria bacterium RIFCSPLOWO2_01_FULL_45_25]OGG83781.1 MAG: hypothetical protein A3I99_04170 [Candidatus Kaiserbacteria bacterium RIFCSPLOWO2_02_FULL_45_11b]OGG85275.1 MAG: hypothetical protein A3G90_04445 [Candidatus Kaiserbacteria bacterium RIFCSPLOWO2_12_FULL_45_26]
MDFWNTCTGWWCVLWYAISIFVVAGYFLVGFFFQAFIMHKRPHGPIDLPKESSSDNFLFRVLLFIFGGLILFAGWLFSFFYKIVKGI